MFRPLTAVALATISVLVLAACGGGSGSSNSSTSSSSYGSPSGSYGKTAAPASKPAARTAVVSARSGPLGTFLVDDKGRSLYLWVADKGSRSMCEGGCAQAWPPLQTTGKPAAGHGVDASLLGTTTRSDGTREVTYAGHPLYLYAGDSQPGQLNGQGSNGFGALWWVVSPKGAAITGRA
jgi:predicted lipoprotein with Yx(FWY)xxD motif